MHGVPDLLQQTEPSELSRLKPRSGVARGEHLLRNSGGLFKHAEPPH
jgi:hypothetical protein